MKKIDTVLFDFDGTLMNTTEVIINSWQHTFLTLDGKKKDEKEIIKTFGEPLSTTMEKFFPNVPVDEAVKVYRKYHYNNFTQLISLFPGMLQVVKELKEKKYKTGIVTSRLKGTTMEGLKKYSMEELFDVVVTMEDCKEHKPNAEPINLALKKLGAKKENSIMIGDTMFDILCAKNAGVKSVLVGWAISVSNEDKNKSDYVIEEARELLNIV